MSYQQNRKMIIVAYFSQQCFLKKFNHIHIIPEKKNFCHTNLILKIDWNNQEMQVFSENSLLKKFNGQNNKNKVMKFKEKNIHLINLSSKQNLDFPSDVEELEIFFPNITGYYNIDLDKVLKKLEKIFQRG